MVGPRRRALALALAVPFRAPSPPHLSVRPPVLLRFPFILALALALAALAPGCLFHPAREGLSRLKVHRGAPWAVTTFRAAPLEEGERPLSELRETLEHWLGPGARGEPRWRGALEPEPADLYERLAAAIDGGAGSITLTAYRYDAAGLDSITLVDYTDERGVLLGSDHVAFPVLPAPPGGRRSTGYGSLAWWEYPQLLLDYAVYGVLGLKELAGEAVKSPLSFLSAGWIGPLSEGRSPVSPVSLERAALAVAEDWRNGWTALTWRFRVRSRHTPLDLLRDAIAAVPIAGPLFDHRAPPADSAPPASTSRIAVTQGIHIGGGDEQYLAAWVRALEEARPGVVVGAAPYRYGSLFDTLWSLLNISHGMGYDLAARLVFEEDVGPGDSVEIVGFSGGAQRALAAARALRSGGITVHRIAGVAGPMAGSSCARETVLLLAEPATDDPVVLTAHLVASLFPILPSNVEVSTVPGAGGHHVPFLPDGATRAPRLGYARRLAEVVGR
ncbi:MAG: hypothetical protein HY721_11500 [Planctomycetes bacterium]|nr:hypothetical protein [Planctomycetota bacterium]